METTRRRKLAAAFAAVAQYRAEVVESCLPQAPSPCPAAPAAPTPTAWAGAGRQHGMLMRVFWQRRLAKSW
jgi:hypothetical protein